MEIYIAKRAGFCFGVKRAVDIAFKTAGCSSGRVATLGPIIHNPQVIGRLGEAGIRPIQSPDEETDTLIIRTHGITAGQYKELMHKGANLIDATCPFVKKAQHYAKLLSEEGYQVIVLGDKKHPEVKGILSYAGEGAIVVEGPDELPRLKMRVGVVVQTTQPVDALKRLLNRVVQTAKEIKVYNTICSSTALRLKETEEMARAADVMIVVGGKNSANTKQLATLCTDIGVKTYHIETSEEIQSEWFAGVERVGITAGASTPDWIIDEIVERLKGMRG